MKVKIFEMGEVMLSSDLSIESQINQWLAAGGSNIRIVHVLQSEAEGTFTITIFYEDAQ